METTKTKNTENKSSEGKMRVKVQKVLQDNLRTPMGMFHGKEINERGFVNDLFKNFNITLKTDEK